MTRQEKALLAVRELLSGTPLKLLVSSCLALYFELLIVRYLSTEIRIFAYLKNIPLIASFLGMGLGMVLGRPNKTLLKIFPFVTGVLFLVIRYASFLHFTHIGLHVRDYVVFGDFTPQGVPAILLVVRYLGVVVGITTLVVAFFLVLGGMVGEYLKQMRQLRGYGINLAGSLAGVGFFTVLSYWRLSPGWWLVIGMSLLVVLIPRQRLTIAILAVTTLAVALPEPNTFWSPYYRIDVQSVAPPAQGILPSMNQLSVNHDYHQTMLDLSSASLATRQGTEPYRSALASYDLPYRLVSPPSDVLIVGAGTGNDVAAALRHGAAHVDAVEIDPVIGNLGRRLHPEHPYDSPKVTLFIDDARAFFKKTNKHYDLVMFGYLDSHTLLTSFSSLRLDNYVYTVESLQEARRLLKPSGSLVLAFASGRSFVTNRLSLTLERAFGVPPVVYVTGYDTSGVTFIEGAARSAPRLSDLREISGELQRSGEELVATDSWPFLYLRSRSIPLSILIVLILFLIGSRRLLRNTIGLPWGLSREYSEMFFLGAGFLLLETKSVTQLSLVFGSTWLVNAVVIAAFLGVALLSNVIVSLRRVPLTMAYVGLFVSLVVSVLVPMHILLGGSVLEKVLAAAVIAALPVFFSGLIFSARFSRVQSPSHALGVNLFGAMVGGILENVVMIGGIPLLGVLALALYGACAIAARLQQGAAAERCVISSSTVPAG